MKKILYIEDELAENVDRILGMFESLLGAKLSKQLGKLDNPLDSKVKQIVEESQMIDVCYTFSDALVKVKENHQDYDLIIIDRDLSEDEYTEEEIQKIDPEFSDKTHIKYVGREGDYLFSLLRDKINDYNSMIYFLTANNDDSLRCQEDMSEPGLSSFNANNIKNKREPEHIRELACIIEDFKKGNFRFKMKDVFEVFDKGLLSKDIEQQFMETLRRKDIDNPTVIKDNLARIRRIQEGIYIALSKNSEDILPVRLIKNDKGFLAMRPIIAHLAEEKHHSGIIKSFAYDVFGISSDGGSHTPYENPDYMPTKYTVQSLTYALCDLLLWFKDIVQK